MTNNKTLKPVQLLTPVVFANVASEGALVIDTRNADTFCDAYVPGAIWIPDPETAVTLVDRDRKIILVTGRGKEAEVQQAFQEAGFEEVSGCLSGGMSAWQKEGMEIDMLITVDAEELELDLKYSEVVVIDARPKEMHDNGKVEGAIDMTLTDWAEKSEDIPTDKSIYIYSQTGKTSLILSSLLKRAGYQRIYQVEGGMQEISKTSVPISKQSRKKSVAKPQNDNE